MAKKSKGRQKIEMTRMSKESNLLVTFSKRRSGLFKKAYELTTLCGVEIAIIVFSPGKKVFSFGHPNVVPIIDRFQNPNSSPSPGARSSQIVEAHRNASVRELNIQLEELQEQLDDQKKRGEDLGKMRKASQGRCWWEAPVTQLGLQEVEQLKEAMEELKKNTAKFAEKIILEASHSNPFLGASSSRGAVGPNTINIDSKIPGLGLSMTAHGYTLGYGRGFF
ncbi:hypothetical protein M9H77_20540 [Catharanthus roseus]|uniref:Uncharacterized protein n=1 Tax=Catharanthus roseus TaxID=4058 RepID=A0ACC0AMI3_CATRO|nr:hypothetical protein M9H77_20540 [Catharanthus roseus]